MKIYDIIKQKRDGGELSREEIEYIANGAAHGTIDDCQLSAWLMAVFFRGMTAKETLFLTEAMAHSGDIADLSRVSGVTIDKHSTGGVGDKTTLIVAPAAAALGCKVAKMSGRGLGHTGGTIDKLESIPGFNVQLNFDDFIDQVNNIGLGIISQTGNITPADKKLYSLRDVTATTDSIPLIASSIMSKKIASGAKRILLDIKFGSGAFMKDEKEAHELSKTMEEIGKLCGLKIKSILSTMDIPLGKCVGNSLEVAEAIRIMSGDITDVALFELCVEITSQMLLLCFGEPQERRDHYRAQATDAILNGGALNKFAAMVKAQGGDISYIDNPQKLISAKIVEDVRADKSGYISSMNTEAIGKVAVILGAGRQSKDQKIDPSSGIIIEAKTGDYVEVGQIIAQLHSNDKSSISQAVCEYRRSIVI